MDAIPANLLLLPEGHNCLLAALPEKIFEHIAPHLELISMSCGEVIYETGGPLHYVYFPTTAIASMEYIMENGTSTEIAGVGNEGVLGISLVMGGHCASSRAVVYTGGYGYRLKVQVLMEEFSRVGGRRAGVMQQLMLRYTQALMNQMSQIAVCNRHHSIEQRLCRWLLQSLDRLPGNELTMTQELIAGMLGVRREGITESAGYLQRAGLIRYHRGHITVLDRSGLELRACECYNIVRKEFYRLFHDASNQQAFSLGDHVDDETASNSICQVRTFHLESRNSINLLSV